MVKTKRIAGLDITEDLAFHQRFWIVQRAGWAVMAAVVVAALAGAFGRGPLSHASLAAEGVRVDYERVVHAGTTTTVTVDARPADAATAQREARVAFASDYVEGMALERVVPAPLRVETGTRQTTFVFSADGTLRVSFTLKPAGAGLHRTDVEVAGQRAGALVQVVLP
jgi:hypothetical protein